MDVQDDPGMLEEYDFLERACGKFADWYAQGAIRPAEPTVQLHEVAVEHSSNQGGAT